MAARCRRSSAASQDSITRPIQKVVSAARTALASPELPAAAVARRRRTAATKSGGERGIRTPGTLPGTAVFKTAAIDRSAISPFERFSHIEQLATIDLLTTDHRLTALTTVESAVASAAPSGVRGAQQHP